MTPKEILINARALIADPENWIHGELAKNNQGQTVNVSAPDATCFCTAGALIKACGGYPDDAHHEALSVISSVVGGDYGLRLYEAIYDFNDSASHAEVLEAFDRAIASYETAGV